MPTDTPTSRPTTGAEQPVPVEELSYEQARDELTSVVSRLEAGGETLEGSLALWERGEALAQRCQEWLDGARRRLEQARAGGPVAAAPAASAGPRTADSHDDPTDPEDGS
ncbi:exodeoxyribonuclease VII small subunit [Actinotalea sp. Marseille-Q4924]|uniref:exodeoxyribonuclease VII small subunit n=1 Tax=Actinotalea sp. Marseille-Q4924 TaxID=2866571 RepID=UPI001CE3F390|nr:exodeoxyribonuclease VII small subunit [Actinotalea sp. Marseille-Q4924]